MPAHGNGDAGSRSRASAAASRRTVSARAAATAMATSAVSCSIASSQCASGFGCSEQAIARAQRALQRVDPRRMRAVDRKHEAIEEAAPLGRGPAEQAVHRRRQPDDTHMISECGGGRNRLAVDPAFARERRILQRLRLMPVPSVAKPSAPSSSAAPPTSRRLRRTRLHRASRAAARVPVQETRSPRSGWSCRRRSARPARQAARRR